MADNGAVAGEGKCIKCGGPIDQWIRDIARKHDNREARVCGKCVAAAVDRASVAETGRPLFPEIWEQITPPLPDEAQP